MSNWYWDCMEMIVAYNKLGMSDAVDQFLALGEPGMELWHRICFDADAHKELLTKAGM